jgi:hypothetical protein
LLPTYTGDLFPTGLVTKVKPNINSVEIHPQLSNKGHPVDGAVVGAGSLWRVGLICPFNQLILILVTVSAVPRRVWPIPASTSPMALPG